MDWYRIASLLVAPPGALIVLFILSLLIHIKRPWLGATLIGICTALFLALSLPLTAYRLMQGLQTFPPLREVTLEPAVRALPAAIIVLGGGRNSDTPEYGTDTVNRMSLERLRYAAALYRQLHIPILVTGGSVNGETVSEAQLMQDTLQRDFNVPVKWIEKKSKTTLENAHYSLAILKSAGIKHIYLVTHAAHMRRAMLAFNRPGFRVTPAPMGYVTLSQAERGIWGYLPAGLAFWQSGRALHEYIGFWWYERQLRTEAASAPSAESPET